MTIRDQRIEVADRLVDQGQMTNMEGLRTAEAEAALDGLAELVEEVKLLRQEIAGAETALMRMAEAVETGVVCLQDIRDALTAYVARY